MLNAQKLQMTDIFHNKQNAFWGVLVSGVLLIRSIKFEMCVTRRITTNNKQLQTSNIIHTAIIHVSGDARITYVLYIFI